MCAKQALIVHRDAYGVGKKTSWGRTWESEPDIWELTEKLRADRSRDFGSMLITFYPFERIAAGFSDRGLVEDSRFPS